GKEMFAIPGAHAFAIAAAKGTDSNLGERLASLCHENGLKLQTTAELRQKVDGAMGGVVAFFWMLVILVFVVNSLGVVNTLTMNVLEQTRTVGILRAVAMKRGQVRKMILAQALGLAVASMVPGVALGIGLAYLMNLTTKPIMGHQVPFH